MANTRRHDGIERKHKLTFLLSLEEMAELNRLAEEERVSLSGWIRARILDDYRKLVPRA